MVGERPNTSYKTAWKLPENGQKNEKRPNSPRLKCLMSKSILYHQNQENQVLHEIEQKKMFLSVPRLSDEISVLFFLQKLKSKVKWTKRDYRNHVRT